jgi:hypothetical protein
MGDPKMRFSSTTLALQSKMKKKKEIKRLLCNDLRLVNSERPLISCVGSIRYQPMKKIGSSNHLI